MREWDPIELLRHVRHDWLNRLQLIKGYQALGKMEKVNEVIEDIVHSSNQESKLSSINMPQLTLLFITYNWESPSFVLNYEIVGDGKAKNGDDTIATEWFETFFQILNNVVTDEEENELSITINHNQEVVSFFVEFYGILKDTSTVQNFLRKKSQRYKTENIRLDNDAFSFELKLL